MSNITLSVDSPKTIRLQSTRIFRLLDFSSRLMSTLAKINTHIRFSTFRPKWIWTVRPTAYAHVSFLPAYPFVDGPM